MARITRISTLNIKPNSVVTLNIKPQKVSSSQYAGKVDLNDTKRYGTFKYAARTYGTTTEYSAGQKMPKIDTREL